MQLSLAHAFEDSGVGCVACGFTESHPAHEKARWAANSALMVKCVCPECPREIGQLALYFPLCGICVEQRMTRMMSYDECCKPFINAHPRPEDLCVHEKTREISRDTSNCNGDRVTIMCIDCPKVWDVYESRSGYRMLEDR